MKEMPPLQLRILYRAATANATFDILIGIIPNNVGPHTPFFLSNLGR